MLQVYLENRQRLRGFLARHLHQAPHLGTHVILIHHQTGG